MTIIYFERPKVSTRRIFIGIKFIDKIYRIGYKTVFDNNNKLRMIRYFYEVDENIKIITNPDKKLIYDKDLEFINNFIYKNI